MDTTTPPASPGLKPAIRTDHAAEPAVAAPDTPSARRAARLHVESASIGYEQRTITRDLSVSNTD